MADGLLENVPAETPLSPEEAIVRRHRKEKKELQGKILALKKSAGKADKKKKKELTEEIHRLETDLELKHKVELDTFLPKRVQVSSTIEEEEEKETVTSNGVDDAMNITDKMTPSIGHNISITSNEVFSTPGTPSKLSKAQKRREKKSALEIERQKRIDDETEILVENSESKKEEDELAAILSDLRLEVHEIPADGNCLYAAVLHQMKQIGKTTWDVQDLRVKTSSYLLDHREEFANYLEDESARESEDGFKKYCNDIKDTAVWGGQVELKVLSKILSKSIHVVQANGPKLVFGEGKPELTLTFHKYKLALGAHYNSAIHIIVEDQ